MAFDAGELVARLLLDTTEFDAKVDAAIAKSRELSGDITATASIDTARFDADAAAIAALKAALESPIVVPVRTDGGGSGGGGGWILPIPGGGSGGSGGAGSGGGSSGGGGGSSGGSGLLGRASGLEEARLLSMMGVPTRMASALALGAPVIISFAATLFEAAAGMTALGIAAAPTLYAIGSGVSTINAANDALAAAIPGTIGWSTALSGVATAWAGIDPQLQGAVAGIENLLQSGGGPLGQQVQGWVAGLITNLTNGLAGKGNSIFAPLILAAEKAFTSIPHTFEQAMGWSSAASGAGSFLTALAKDVGPAVTLMTQFGAEILRILTGIAQIGAGGQGMALLDQFLATVADLLHTGLFAGFVQGFVTVDRVALTLLDHLLKVLSIVNALDRIGIVKFAAEVLGAAYGMYRIARVLGFIDKTGALVIPGVVGGAAPAAAAADVAPVAAVAGVGAAADVAAVDASAAGAAGATTFFRGFLGALTTGPGLAVLAGTAAVVAFAKYAVPFLAQGSAADIARNKAWAAATTPAAEYASSITGWAPYIHLYGAHYAPPSHSASIAAQIAAFGTGVNFNAATRGTIQYNNALLGAIPTTGHMTSALQGLLTASEQIGGGLQKAAYGTGLFTNLTVAHAQTVSGALAGMASRSGTLEGWYNNVESMLQRHISPAFISYLVNQAPQDIGMAAHATTAQLNQMMVGWYTATELGGMATDRNFLQMTQYIENELKTTTGAAHEAAVQIAIALKLPIPGIESAWQIALARIAAMIGATAAQAAALMASQPITFLHTRPPPGTVASILTPPAPPLSSAAAIAAAANAAAYARAHHGLAASSVGLSGLNTGGSLRSYQTIHIHVDARGSTNPAATTAMVTAGVQSTIPKLRLAISQGAGVVLE